MAYIPEDKIVGSVHKQTFLSHCIPQCIDDIILYLKQWSESVFWYSLFLILYLMQIIP